MMERIPEMPGGTIGVQAVGKLTRDDYVDVLEPALKEGVESGELRLLFVLTDFDGLEPGAWLEDVKTGLAMEFGHRQAWKKLAFVTNVEWVATALHTFAWAIPAELMIGGVDELGRAMDWIAN